jgi:hypothetical protein
MFTRLEMVAEQLVAGTSQMEIRTESPSTLLPHEHQFGPVWGILRAPIFCEQTREPGKGGKSVSEAAEEVADKKDKPTRPRPMVLSLTFATFLSTFISLPPAETKDSGLRVRASDRP